MRAKRRAGRWSLGSELPEEAFSGGSRITLFGRRCVLIEGHQGVVEMSDSCIRFRSSGCVIGIYGKELGIKELSLDAAMITGAAISTVSCGESPCRGGNARADDA